MYYVNNNNKLVVCTILSEHSKDALTLGKVALYRTQVRSLSPPLCRWPELTLGNLNWECP